jgi:hypothetical protein
MDLIKDESFKITIPHNIAYEKHIFILNKSIKKAYFQLNKNQIKNNLKNYKYLKHFIRFYLENMKKLVLLI